MLNNVKENEVDLYLQTEKKDYWKDRLRCLKILLATIFLTFFVLFGMCVTIWMIVNKPEILFKYIVSTIIVLGFIYLLSHVVYELLVYKYFFKKRHRTKFYRKYMDRFLLVLFLTGVIVIALSVMSRYIEYYWLLGFTFSPMLLGFVLPKYKKLKAQNPSLPELSLYLSLYREKLIEQYDAYLFKQFPLLINHIQEIAYVYYYLNVVLYDSKIESISLGDENIYEEIIAVCKEHIESNNNHQLFNEIDSRAFTLNKNLRRDNFKNLLDDFFA